MNRTNFARCIAPSLTLGAWTYEAVLAGLLRRLPSELHRFGPRLAEGLLAAFPMQYAPCKDAVATDLIGIDAFERVFLYCQKHSLWPTPDLTPTRFAPIAAFAELAHPRLATVAELADWLFLPVERLDYLADLTSRYEEHGETSINHYHYDLRVKTSGGVRLIEAPKQGLKAVQRRILKGIIDVIPSHPDAFGFVSGRNCVQAASRHSGEEMVVCFDLKDYFPSIGAGRVFGLFRCLGYPHTVARYLTALCTTQTPPRVLGMLLVQDRQTYQAAHLPQGSPASPGLANQISFNLDRRLSALAGRMDANYSRYADDLTFSGARGIAHSLARSVSQIVQEEGFAINASKSRSMKGTGRQTVTGLVVNQHININRRDFDALKAIIHACGKPADRRLYDATFRESLLGKIGWVETINPNRGQKLRRLLSAAWENHQDS
ncbi:MAG: reverse transcriptase family protein [Marinosulfonomonas sp.]